jgi:O6-methylguanine-DNA--protein-cysteine methyltransferase
MAGKGVSEIYCWEIEWNDLKIHLASSDRGALRVGITLDKNGDCVTYFRDIYPSRSIIKDKSRNRPLSKSVEAALDNRHDRNRLPLDIKGTPFQTRVWESLKMIPFGQTRTYGEVASMVGTPRGARAVGQALGRNPLPLVFP